MQLAFFAFCCIAHFERPCCIFPLVGWLAGQLVGTTGDCVFGQSQVGLAVTFECIFTHLNVFLFWSCLQSFSKFKKGTFFGTKGLNWLSKDSPPGETSLHNSPPVTDTLHLPVITASAHPLQRGCADGNPTSCHGRLMPSLVLGAAIKCRQIVFQ